MTSNQLSLDARRRTQCQVGGRTKVYMHQNLDDTWKKGGNRASHQGSSLFVFIFIFFRLSVVHGPEGVGVFEFDSGGRGGKIFIEPSNHRMLDRGTSQSDAMKSKARTYPELLQDWRCRLGVKLDDVERLNCNIPAALRPYKKYFSHAHHLLPLERRSHGCGHACLRNFLLSRISSCHDIEGTRSKSEDQRVHQFQLAFNQQL